MSAAKKTYTLSGTIESVVYHNDMNDYTVLEIANDDNELITAVGTIPMAFEGECVILYGDYTYHKEFGRQFVFDTFEKTLPKEIDGILQYLSSKTIKGVGPVTAKKIVDRYGADSFDVIENHAEWLSDIPGITMKKAMAISESFREQTGAREVVMFCKDYIGATEATKIYKKLGSDTVSIIRDNPYILCSGEYGIPFESADSMAMSLGISPDSEFRVLSGVEYIFSYNGITNGHTCLPYDKLIDSAVQLLKIPAEKIADLVDSFISTRRICSYSYGDDIYLMSLEAAAAETYVAQKLSVLSSSSVGFTAMDTSYLIERAERSGGIVYADMQKYAINSAIQNGVVVITGGPGTGKTTIVKALCTIFDSVGLKVVLAAPTGRAAKRMSEATSMPAKTIHRLLETERGANGSNKFNRNDRIPLDERVIIIDEASMIDLYLMEALLRAVKAGSHLILIGDSDQLPSVGAGNVLADIIASESFPTIRLTDIFRQSEESLIVTNAHSINDGKAPDLSATDKDFFFVRRENTADIPSTIASLITQRLPRTYGASISEKIQVITPSKKGDGGVESLNRELQSAINPERPFKREKLYRGITYREGDKVMQNVNDYDIEWERDGTDGFGVFNGDIGVIEKIDERNDTVLVRYEDKLAKYSFDMLEELDLAYAITVHKSQGSEYPVVIVPMYNCAPMLMTRNLLYTAVTRAKSMIILVGKAEIPYKMVANNRHILRYTSLGWRICDYN